MMVTKQLWKYLFLLLPFLYMLLYAPFGINESDGGFITGLAWQVCSGKTLYQDIVYVRPPMSIWLRTLELRLLPENWAILYERCFFYLKVALYTYCAASLLDQKGQKWVLAAFGYVVSVHCYPAAAWHTIDGILFAVLSIWLLFKAGTVRYTTLYLIVSALCVVASSMCKQSFYPMLALWPLVLWVQYTGRYRIIGWAAQLAALAAFFGFLAGKGVLSSYLAFTSGATGSGQAITHGIYDYFDINALLAVPFLCVLGLLLFIRQTGNDRNRATLQWILAAALLAMLPGSYMLTVWKNQEFTIPFAQSRLLFDLSAVWGLYCWYRGSWSTGQSLRFAAILGVSWCAAMSWGYNLPILCAVPWVYAALTCASEIAALPNLPTFLKRSWTKGILPAYFVLLLLVFGYAYTFVYSDGKRGAMQTELGSIFPKLQGIYTSNEHAALYSDLKRLALQYGPDFKTLPSFTLANYLTDTNPPMPLDWVVQRELSDKYLINSVLDRKNTTFFIQKSQIEKIQIDPELKFTRIVLEKGNIIAETAHFLVVRTSHE